VAGSYHSILSVELGGLDQAYKPANRKRFHPMKVSELVEVFQAASKSLVWDKMSSLEFSGFWIGENRIACQCGYSQTIVEVDLGIETTSGYIIDSRILKLLLLSKHDKEKAVKIKKTDAVVTLKIEKNQYKIPVIGSEFHEWNDSELDKSDKPQPFILRGRLFSSMLASVISASSDIPDSPLSGIMIVLSKNQYKGGATNGKEMAYYSSEQNLAQVEGETSFLLPLKTVIPIIQLLKEVDLFQLTVSSSFATFTIGKIEHKVRLKDSRNYPPIFRLLEGVEDLPKIGSLSPKQMLLILSRLEVVAALKKKDIKRVLIELTGDALFASLQYGEAVEEIDIEQASNAVTQGKGKGKILVDMELIKKALKAFSGSSTCTLLFDKGRLALRNDQSTRLIAGFLVSEES
jgi:DNA polymerase III sliding clamp (beta) subunit (PCNA family)